MTLAAFALLAALLVALAGNGAGLAEVVARQVGRAPVLLVATLAGQAAIAALLVVAGAALTPAVGHAVARVIAAGLLAVTVLLVLRPYPLSEPVEPTRSFAAIGIVAAAYAVRDGLASLALALGLITGDIGHALAGMVFGSALALGLAMRGAASAMGIYARYLAAILLAMAAFYIGALAA